MHPAERRVPFNRTPTHTAPREVEVVCQTFLALCDEMVPGAIEGLYLHGSVAFGDWLAHTSDIDFVAVSATRPDPDLLRGVHLELQATFPSPSFDGPHLTWADLAAPASACPDVPVTLGGTWEDEGRVDVSPVTWHELARHGVHQRGPALSDVQIHLDDAELWRFTRENLATYWADLVDGLAAFPAEAAKPEMVAWTVLGTARLHHLLAEGRLTSKSGAGQYALETFGAEHAAVIREALSWRTHGQTTGEYDGDEARRAADTIALTRLIVDSGLDLAE